MVDARLNARFSSFHPCCERASIARRLAWAEPWMWLPSRGLEMPREAKKQLRAELASRKHSVVRDEILIAAARLFAERGFRAVTMDDIARSLEYVKSVIYYYFKSKNEILWQIYCRSFEKFSGDIEAIRDEKMSSEAGLAKMIRAHALNVMKNRDGTAIYISEESELNPQQRQQLSRMKRSYDAVFESVYQRGVAEGVFRDVPPHVAVGGILGMCNSLHVWYNEKGSLSAEQIADYFVILLSIGYKVDNRSAQGAADSS
jgi:AcrR family transcriptional regulator